MKKATMKVTEVVKYFTNRGMTDTAHFFKSVAMNGRECDTDGNMNADFIRLALSIGDDDTLFRELQCEVTTQVPF